MQTFGINEYSEYCNIVNTILDICRIYRSPNKEINSVHAPFSYRSPEKRINEQETIGRLANIVMDFYTMSLDSDNENKEQLKEDQILECLIDDNQEPPQIVIPFDVETFYSFIRGDMNNENMGQMLQPMHESMGTKFEKKKNVGE